MIYFSFKFMANEEQLKILSQDVDAWNKWRAENVDVRIDLTEVALREAILSGANLSEADLYGADLYGADLDGADLSGVNLSKTDLSKTKPSKTEDSEKPTPDELKREPVQTGGPSPHIATDSWTVVDALGYNKYAFAIYSFMIHKQTKTPLTISIQAPWGAGKTSLMKMVEQQFSNKLKELDRSSITVKDVQDEIRDWKTKGPKELPPQNRILTIWFNPWMYQSANEVWAGLADAIIRQVAKNLPPKQREYFWLRLNLNRIDPDKIRYLIHEKIINEVWQKAIPWLVGSVFLFLVSFLLILVASMQTIGIYGIVASTFTAFFSLSGNYIKTLVETDKKPASFLLSDYLQMPDYRSELGFIHHVEQDLNRVFESIPKACKPKIVVFIDDLDRCSPQKISEVSEGINLFLANDFPVMFVMGMDTEMVAAALEVAQASVISRLPPDTTTPIGWRFMDKFVQLPFVVPRPDRPELLRYINSLLSYETDDGQSEREEKVKRIVDEIYETGIDPNHPEDAMKYIEKEVPEIREKVQDEIEKRKIYKNLESKYKNYNDGNKEIRDQIVDAAADFSYNPRALKRFINEYRFQYFLWSARCDAQNMEEFPLKALRKWVIFTMKWPQVLRWIQGGVNIDRLQLLEQMGEGAETPEIWYKNAKEIARLNIGEASWLGDESLRKFFYDENKLEKNERLSNFVSGGFCI
jgi:hypothetical protein